MDQHTSGPIVEVGYMGIQPSKSPLDVDTDDGKILIEAWKAIITAPGGPERIFWGAERGSSQRGGVKEEEGGETEGQAGERGRERLWAWFDWSNLEAHEEFAKSFGGKATSRFGEVFTPGFTKHAFHSTTPLRSPITQIFLSFFTPSFTEEEKDAVVKAFERVEKDVVRRNEGVQGVSGGWGLETDFPVRKRGGKEAGRDGDDLRDGEGQAKVEIERGAVFFVLVGWEKVDEVKLEEVRENLALMVEMQGAVAWDEFCVSCEVLERKGGNEEV